MSPLHTQTHTTLIVIIYFSCAISLRKPVGAGLLQPNVLSVLSVLNTCLLRKSGYFHAIHHSFRVLYLVGNILNVNSSVEVDKVVLRDSLISRM